MVHLAAAQVLVDVEAPITSAEAATSAIERAVAEGAEIIVLPELANSGYLFTSMREVQESATTLDGPLISQWSKIAKSNAVVIVAGINLFEAGKYWNASVIIDESGLRGWYAKAHLFGDEPKFFTPGDRPPLVVETSKGRVATMICYDIEFTEWVRLAMLAGAQLLALPTNWPIIGQTETSPPMEVVRVQAAASQNKMVIVAADRCGRERGQEWVSASAITSDEGVVVAIADRTQNERTQIIHATLDLPTDTAITAQNDVRKDRRPALYSSILNQ